jgi:hypothetical protein
MRHRGLFGGRSDDIDLAKLRGDLLEALEAGGVDTVIVA